MRLFRRIAKGKTMTDNGYTEDTLVEEVAIKDMFMEPTYGRELHQKFVKDMAAAWDSRAAGVILLSMRSDGRFAVLDGWHRVSACRIAHGEDATMAAKVLIDLTPKEEAQLFDRYNRNRKAPFINETFKARLAYDEPKAVALNNLVESFGLKISLGRQQQRGEMRAVGVLERCIVSMGLPEFRHVLSMMTQALPLKDITPKLIEGLNDFWLRYADLADEDRIVHKIRDMGGRGWQLKANNMMAVAEMVTSQRYGGPHGMVLRAAYNWKLRSGQLPDWVVRGVVVSKVVQESRKKQPVA